MPTAAKQHGGKVQARKPKKIRPPKISDPFYSGRRWRKVRKIALLRDCYTCTECGCTPMRSSNLHVDHIEPRQQHPSREYDVDNLQTLCIGCHNVKTHSKRIPAQIIITDEVCDISPHTWDDIADMESKTTKQITNESQRQH